MRIIILFLALALRAFATSSTCSNSTLTLAADVVLTGSQTVSWVNCTINGANFRIIAATFTGSITITGSTVNDLGSYSAPVGLSMIGGATSGSVAYFDTGAFLDIENTTFNRSHNINFQLNVTDNSSFTSFTFSNNTVSSDAIFPEVKTTGDNDSPGFIFEQSNGATSKKFVQGNKIYKGWVETVSQNWTIGATSGCTPVATCVAQGNIITGFRAGISAPGANAYVAYNYTHCNPAVTATETYWSQLQPIVGPGAGGTFENNVFRTGHWVTRSVVGTLQNNVILEMHGHDWVDISAGGTIKNNIFAGAYPGVAVYNDGGRQAVSVAGIELATNGNALTFNSNTMDFRGRAAGAVAFDVAGTTISYKDNVAYQAYLLSTNAALTPNPGPAGSPPYPSLATYLDYNYFNLVSGSPGSQIYGIGISGVSECAGNFGTHDVGGCPTAGQTDPLFRGPLPIGKSVYLTGAPATDSGFPFNDSDIYAGTYTVDDLLTYYRWIYSPQSGSPLRGVSSTGGDIGAVAFNAGSTPAIVTTNKRPSVYAGLSFTVGSGATAELCGYAGDDALPSATLTTTWSKINGPGTVTFGSTSATITTASTTADGTYVFRLTATDGTLSSTSDATIIFGTPSPSATTISGLTKVSGKVVIH